MKDITIAELEENFDTVFDEISDGETFTICDNDGQPLAVLMPSEEYESLLQREEL
jgi:antitoxin (DNA-binding transcriptional repressor) of toxin-antitoxin stability system